MFSVQNQTLADPALLKELQSKFGQNPQQQNPQQRNPQQLPQQQNYLPSPMVRPGIQPQSLARPQNPQQSRARPQPSWQSAVPQSAVSQPVAANQNSARPRNPQQLPQQQNQQQQIQPQIQQQNQYQQKIEALNRLAAEYQRLKTISIASEYSTRDQNASLNPSIESPDFYMNRCLNEMDRRLSVLKQVVADYLRELGRKEDTERGQAAQGFDTGKDDLKKIKKHKKIPHLPHQKVPGAIETAIATSIERGLEKEELQNIKIKLRLISDKTKNHRDTAQWTENYLKIQWDGIGSRLLAHLQSDPKTKEYSTDILTRMKDMIMKWAKESTAFQETEQTKTQIKRSIFDVQDSLLHMDLNRIFRGKEENGPTKLILRLLVAEENDVQTDAGSNSQRKLIERKREIENDPVFQNWTPQGNFRNQEDIDQFKSFMLKRETKTLMPFLNADKWDLSVNDAFIDTGIRLKYRFTIGDISQEDKNAVLEISQQGKNKDEKLRAFIEYCQNSKNTQFKSRGNRMALAGRASFKYSYTILAREIMQLLAANYYFVNIPATQGKLIYAKNEAADGFDPENNWRILNEQDRWNLGLGGRARLEGKQMKLMAFPSKEEYIHYLNNKVQHAINDNNEAQRKRYKKLLKKVR